MWGVSASPTATAGLGDDANRCPMLRCRERVVRDGRSPDPSRALLTDVISRCSGRFESTIVLIAFHQPPLSSLYINRSSDRYLSTTALIALYQPLFWSLFVNHRSYRVISTIVLVAICQPLFLSLYINHCFGRLRGVPEGFS